MFADLVQDGYLSKQRADHCDYEYQVFKQAWLDQMSPHIDRQRAAAVLCNLAAALEIRVPA